MRTLISTALTTLATALPGLAQDGPTAAELQQIEKDLDHVFARPSGTVDRDQALERFAAFFAKYEGRDLGPFGYARGLFHYWNREPDKAIEALDRYLDKHDPGKIDSREQRMMIGRIYLSAAARGSTDGTLDEARFVDLARKFARCYDDLQSVAHYVTRNLGKDRQVLAARARDAMVAEVLARKLPDATTAAMIRAIHGDAPARGAGRTARAAAPKRPTTLKPFTATAMSGAEIDLAAMRGKVVLVDFWATWCAPCLREMPNVVDAHAKYASRGFTVVGVSLDKPDAEQAIRDTSKRLGMTWEQIYDGGYWSAALAKENGIRSIPAAFLIDRSGKVRFSGTETRGARLAANIETLLAEK